MRRRRIRGSRLAHGSSVKARTRIAEVGPEPPQMSSPATGRRQLPRPGRPCSTIWGCGAGPTPRPHSPAPSAGTRPRQPERRGGPLELQAAWRTRLCGGARAPQLRQARACFRSCLTVWGTTGRSSRRTACMEGTSLTTRTTSSLTTACLATPIPPHACRGHRWKLAARTPPIRAAGDEARREATHSGCDHQRLRRVAGASHRGPTPRAGGGAPPGSAAPSGRPLVPCGGPAGAGRSQPGPSRGSRHT
mmetsp:Transcript_49893/g.154688  ORF Transcript_49893/g.154688 Transcript_49893/m.154688 type:complete len:248 (+) Transcript_49893:183-926(+)